MASTSLLLWTSMTRLTAMLKASIKPANSHLSRLVVARAVVSAAGLPWSSSHTAGSKASGGAADAAKTGREV